MKLDMELCGYVDALEKEQKVEEDAGVEVVVNISDGSEDEESQY